jgi:N-acetyl-gamma-glutamyl-phosphate reductase
MIRISIVGATGYTGGELLRHLLRHPEAEIKHVTSENFVGQPISAVHKFSKGRIDLICEKYNPALIARDTDVAFLGLPHGTSSKTAAELIEKGIRVIDLSADFRLEDLPTYEKWYGRHEAPKLLPEAVFGLPERYREKIRKARLIANPGCYATTAILAGLPIMADGILGEGPVIVDAKSGVSGAGRKLDPTFLYSEANESMQAYGLKGHRHHPEILQEWRRAMKTAPGSGLKGKASPRAKSLELIFVPHLAPMSRGIFATLYAPLTRRVTSEELMKIYQVYYADEPFVQVLKPMESPEVRAVANTNMCHIGVATDESGKTAIVMAALDNLIKGASGQAIQNMNLMFGIKESEGLL